MFRNSDDNAPRQIITGDPLKDGPDLTDPDHLQRAIDRLKAAGVELPKVLEAELKRLQHMRDVRAQHGFVLAELERLHIEERAAERRAERDRTVTFPPEPADDSDWLVIGEQLDTWRGGGEDTAQEVGGKIYRFDPYRVLHFVPAAVGEAWPHRRGLPGRRFVTAPSDLLRAYRNDFTRVRAGGMQGAGPGYVDVETNDEGLLAAAARIARACSYRPLLTTWLESARAAGDDLNGMLARVIEQRLQDLASSEDAG